MRLFAGDTETSNAERTPGGVCEVALIEITEDLEYVGHFESRIDPEEPICPGASGVHGITNADVEDCPTLEEWADLVHIREMGLAAHNAPFDAMKLSAAISIPSTLDTLRLARHAYPDAPNHKLSTLVYYLNLPRSTGSFHSAMTDTWALFYLLQRLAVDLDCHTFSGLSVMSHTPRQLENFPNFGKHAGIPFADVPTSYLSWCMNNFTDMDIDLKFSIEKRLGKA